MPLVVALGDSITYGYGLPSPPTQNYAALYASRIHARLTDLARPGATCEDVLDRQVPPIAHDTALVIVNCGVNDIGGFGFTPSDTPDASKHTAPANDFELAAAMRDHARLIAAIRARAPHAKIILVNVSHWQRASGGESRQFAKDVERWNAMLARERLPLVDVSDDARLTNRAYLQPDLLHPNRAGNAAIAADFLR